MKRFVAMGEQLQGPANQGLWRLLDGFGTKKSVTRSHERFILFEEEGHRQMLLPFYPPDMRRTYPWFACDEQTREFFVHFAGLRESPPGSSGAFVDGTRRFKLRSILRQLGASELEENRPLLDCPVLFEAANGDILTISPSGEVLWLQVSTGAFLRREGAFADWLETYTRWRQAQVTPFDSTSV